MSDLKTVSQLPSDQFKIDGLEIPNRLALAPMDGYTDSPFRRIAKRFGAGLLYSEFINGMDVVINHPALKEKLSFTPEERPFGIQLFDDDPERLLKASQIVAQRYQPDFIDINFGCPNRRVVSRGAGAALLAYPERLGRMVNDLYTHSDIPITAKIRLGPDADTRNHLDVTRIIEENGAQCIAVHGRTTDQGLKGKADWDAIAEVCQTISIPVIGNGDVSHPHHITEKSRQANCEGIMIGRGAIGNPWIFSYQDKRQISKEEVIQVMAAHLELSMSFYGRERGLIIFRKHANEYIDSLNPSKQMRKELLTCRDPETFLAVAQRN